MGKKVDIDNVIADIESAIAENSVQANVDAWIAEAKSLAKKLQISKQLNKLCDVHAGVPFVIDR